MSETRCNGLLRHGLPPSTWYRPLQGAEIRYLGLQPYRESVGLIECCMHYAPIESAEYYALSYSWGDAMVKETILVDNHPFQITTNLASFMKALNAGRVMCNWSQDLVIHLWVDAICINQDDILERSQQVLRMNDIYKRALRVLIWLGPHIENTELAFVRMAVIDKEVAKLSKDKPAFPQFTELARRLLLEDPNDGLERATKEGLEDLANRI